jgi:hypothetical protein
MDVYITERLRGVELQANIYGRDNYNENISMLLGLPLGSEK